MPSTFKGGIHPDYHKDFTCATPIEKLPPSQFYVFPLSQHIGKPCTALVNVGDAVTVGQRIAESDSPMSAPIFSSVSGKVVAIEPRPVTSGFDVLSIVIENDYKDTVCDNLIATPKGKTLAEYTPEEIIKIAKDAGLVGMGGAAFPTAVKLTSAIEKKVNTVIINGCECEPYITSDHRAMLEYPRFIVGGIRLILQCLNLDKAYLAIENNKKDAIDTMRKIIGNDDKIIIKELQTKYPQGGEKQLIRSVLGYEISPGKLPLDAGVAVFNVDTCASLYRASVSGFPLIKRIVTVSGDKVNAQKNLLVRLGTPVSELFNYCGGLKKDAERIIAGGPMMGFALHTLDVPVVKGTSAVLAFGYDKSHYATEDATCIRCGKCVAACPMKLMPNYINLYISNGRIDLCEKYNVMDCIECGCCAYSCPQRLYLIQSMRIAKEKVRFAKQTEVKK